MSEFKKVKRTISIQISVDLEARTYCGDRFGDDWAKKDAEYIVGLIQVEYGEHLLRHILTAKRLEIKADGRDEVEDVSPEREAEIRTAIGRE